MTTIDVTDLVQAAAAALRAGERRTARILLTQALAEDPDNERALLWLSGAVDSPTQQRACLERVLAINPANRAAQIGLASLETAEEPILSPLISPPDGYCEQSTSPSEWVAPEPIPAAKLDITPVACYACGGQLYGKAAFCWRCHAAVHVCANCEFAQETRCKEVQSIDEPTHINTCIWWRPS